MKIRSLTVKGVKQELWGIFLAYNLVRLEMERIADEAHVDPIRISFVTALSYIRDEWFWLCGPRTDSLQVRSPDTSGPCVKTSSGSSFLSDGQNASTREP